MSFITDRIQFLRDGGDCIPMEKKRSESRIKAYESATDARSWGDETEDRRQHILELIKHTYKGMSLGKYIPIEVLIDILTSNKNSLLNELQNELAAYRALKLTPEQRAQLENSKGKPEAVAPVGETAKKKDVERISSGKEASDEDCRKLLRELQQQLKDKEKEIENERAMARKAVEKLEALKDIVAERDALRKELGKPPAENVPSEMSKTESKPSTSGKDADKSKSADKTIQPGSSQKSKKESEDEKAGEKPPHYIGRKCRMKTQKGVAQDLEDLDKDMEERRAKGQLSPDEEADMIKQELSVLKKCCEKLAAIEKENEKLRDERDALKGLVQGMRPFDEIPTKHDFDAVRSQMRHDLRQMQAVELKLDSLRENEFADDGDESDQLNTMNVLKEKAAAYDKVVEERDALKARLADLNGSLEDVELHKQKSKILEDMVNEQTSRLNALEDLKTKSEQFEEMKKEVEEQKCRMVNVEGELEEKVCECDDLRRERDMLKMKVADGGSTEEVQKLRYRLKEAEVYKIERDRLKERVDDLEHQMKSLEEKTVDYDCLLRERKAYKASQAEMYELQCEVEALRLATLDVDALKRQVQECSCTIQDQEDEIQRLLEQVDWLSKRREKQQTRMKGALTEMRQEMEKKNSLIALSDEKLEQVQQNLRATIADVAQQKQYLAVEIADLHSEVDRYRNLLQEKQTEIDYLYDHLETKNGVIQEMSSERTNTTKIEEDFKQSLCICRKLEQELVCAGNRNEELAELIRQSKCGGDKHVDDLMKISKKTVEHICKSLGNLGNLPARTGKMPECESGAKKEEKGDGDKWEAIIKKLQEEKKSLEDELARCLADKKSRDAESGNELQKVNDMLEKEIEKLKAEIANLKQQIGDGDQVEIISRLQEELRMMKGEREEMERQLKLLSGDIEDLNQALEQCRKEHGPQAAIAPSTSSTDDSLNKLKKENDDLRNEITQLKDIINNLKSEKADISEKEDLESLKKTNKELNDLVNSLRKENEELKNELMQLRKSMESSNKDLLELNALRKENEKLLSENVDLEMLKSENEELKNELNNLKKQLESLKSSAGDLQNEINKLKSENEELKKEIGQLKASQIVESKSDTGAKENEDLKNEIKKLKDQLNAASKDDSSKKENDDLKNEINRLKSELEKSTAEIMRLNAPSVSEKEAEDYRNEINKLKAELEQSKVGAKASVSDNKENEDLKNQIEKLKNDLQKASKSAEGLNDALKENEQLKKENDDLRKELEALKAQQSKTGDLQNEIDRLKKENDELKKNLKEQPQEPVVSKDDKPNEELDRLKKENEELRKQNAALQDELNALKKKLQELQPETKEPKPQEEEPIEAEAESELAEEVDKLEKQVSLISEPATQEREEPESEQPKSDAKGEKEKEEPKPVPAKSESKSVKIGEDKPSEDYVEKITSLENQLEKERRESNDQLTALKNQKDREMKDLHNKYNQGIAKLQQSHEEILEDVAKDHESETSSLREQNVEYQKELKKKADYCICLEAERNRLRELAQKQRDRGDLSMKTMKTVDICPCSPLGDIGEAPISKKDIGPFRMKPAEPAGDASDIKPILQKILDQGFEALSFAELSNLHQMTCNATANVLPRSGQHSSPIPTKEADRLSLMRKIAMLERDLVKKQKNAQQKISDLQLCVKAEKQRLHEFKNALSMEKQRNQDLQLRYPRSIANLEEERNLLKQHNCYCEKKIESFVVAIENERARVKQLEEELQRERMLNQSLQENTNNAMHIHVDSPVDKDHMLCIKVDQKDKHRRSLSPPSRVPAAIDNDAPPSTPRGIRGSTSEFTVENPTSFYTELAVDKNNKYPQCAVSSQVHAKVYMPSVNKSSSRSQALSPFPEDEHNEKRSY